eukprot:CAMPEP_0198358022 /NCGR_PEP_ID=MMETSP1450-20131203/129106_1 /TAXON_ID=753684 ORGANISM="Madagascaria erythrocladiodes, Strain CCMP3234" /NCGR_SAMPLE_ID=MMETSP1450 /ASSEMBLY_ACC=CAM_ASM_001115 /LENGTH=83 /DNA_ID=CAMNT_0044064721 /DNA_START=117 /DNA_END=365 /DNA_ORIENTATION=-
MQPHGVDVAVHDGSTCALHLAQDVDATRRDNLVVRARAKPRRGGGLFKHWLRQRRLAHGNGHANAPRNFQHVVAHVCALGDND